MSSPLDEPKLQDWLSKFYIFITDYNSLGIYSLIYFSYIAFLILYLTASPFCIFNEKWYVSLHSTILIYPSLHALNKEMVLNIKVLIFKSVKYISRYMISVRYKYTKIVHIYQGKKSVLCTLKNKMTPPPPDFINFKGAYQYSKVHLLSMWIKHQIQPYRGIIKWLQFAALQDEKNSHLRNN